MVNEPDAKAILPKPRSVQKANSYQYQSAEHPRRAVAELKSKNDQTGKKARFYRADIVVIKTLTGQ